jgi:predicted DNA-binding transcriptional regulator
MNQAVRKDEEEVGGKVRVSGTSNREALTGTTRQVYRYIYKHGPVRLHEIERDLELSSSSVADYHVQKLLRMRMIREESGQESVPGYVTDEAVFEAMIRIRHVVIPVWTTTTAFFAASLIVLFTFLRPPGMGSTYLFSLVVIAVAFFVCAYEALEGLRGGVT